MIDLNDNIVINDLSYIKPVSNTIDMITINKTI
jgi:hypothetical protein